MKNVEDCKLTVAPTSRSDTDNDKIASLKENLSVNCETPKLSKKEIKVNSSKKEAISKKEPVKKEVSTPQNSPKMESPVSLGVSRPKLMTQMPKWTPPARASKNSSSGGMRSNNLSPGFRVGLSRNVKVTPLHPNVKLK